DHMRYAHYNIVQINPLPWGLLFSYHSADLANDVAGAPRISADIGEEIADLLRIDLAAINETLSCAGVAGNSCERLIQFVGNRRGHFANQGYTAEMTQLLTPLLGFDFGLFSSSNIDADSQDPRRSSASIEVDTPTRRHPTHDSVR